MTRAMGGDEPLCQLVECDRCGTLSYVGCRMHPTVAQYPIRVAVEVKPLRYGGKWGAK